jgi:hypothetical protein
MKAIVVYESLWGNTATIARAIADGIGPGARALTTAEASVADLADTDLLVAGSPVLGFSLPTESMRETIRTRPGKAPAPPDLSHPPMRSWLATLPKQKGRAAAFETRIWWSPGGATGAILAGLANAGYRTIGKGQRFIVSGPYGPLREGEVERARLWGAELAEFVGRGG